MALLCKDKKEEGSAGASPVAAPMPKSVPFVLEGGLKEAGQY